MKKYFWMIPLLIWMGMTNSAHAIFRGTLVQSWKEFPFIVELGGGQCGATILSPSWLLSAGHCGKQKVAQFGGLQNEQLPFSATIDQVIRHPKYTRAGPFGPPPATYDFELLHLAQPIDFAATGARAIRFADPVFSNAYLKSGVLCTLVGWGWTESSTINSQPLREVMIPYATLTQLKQSDPEDADLYNASILAAGDLTGLRGSCYGDSGGPLVLTDPVTKEWVQVGVVSGSVSASCGVPGFYDLYGNVSEVSEWISHTIER